MKLNFQEKIALFNSSNNNNSSQNNVKKISEKKETKTLYIGKLFGKHLLYGSKKIGEIKEKKNTLQLYGYPVIFDNSLNEESISIFFVGQSGAGKFTFINAYVNYLFGITNNDDIRYKLILGDKSKEKDQTKSQTDFIIQKLNSKIKSIYDEINTIESKNIKPKEKQSEENTKKEFEE